MPLDLKALDERIRKLQMLRELASDPEVAEILSELVNTNENGHIAQQRIFNTNDSASAPDSDSIYQPTTEEGQRQAFADRVPRGYVLDMVRQAVKNMPELFTSENVLAYMTETMRFQFRSARPLVTVNEAMRTMEMRNEIKRVDRVGLQIIWAVVPHSEEISA
jgi:hypothetical protein